MNLEALFTYSDTTYRLSIDQEVEAIRGAQAGDPEATEALLRLYGPTIRATVNRAKKTIDEDEARSVALLAFAEILESHNIEDENYSDPRLASRLTPHLKDRLGEAQAQAHAFTIPKRTLTRFYGILRNADGDPVRAAEIAEDYGMSREVFETVLTSLQADSLNDQDETVTSEGGSGRYRSKVERIESATSLWNSHAEAGVEDRLMVKTAFEAVDDDEARICELAYGFTEYDPVPDGEIAHRMGLSRPKVQRQRNGALNKMRKATGVLPPE